MAWFTHLPRLRKAGVDPKNTWIAVAKCCREWEVLMPYPIRSCKLCGQRPVVGGK